MKKQNLFQNAAQILYGKKDDEEQNKNKERNDLLNELGNDLTPAQTLYSTNDDLKRIKEKRKQEMPKLGIKEKITNFIDSKLPKKEIEPLKGSVSYYDYAEDYGQNDEKFQTILKNIYGAEGGFSDDKYDRGGRTNFGITQKTYDDYNKKHKLPLKDVKDITKNESDKIYYNEYYKASGADKIQDKDLAYMHFDAAVNHGVGRAKQFIENAGDDFDRYYQIRKEFYDNLATNGKDQKKFYNGWINRIDKIKNNRGRY